MSKSLLYGIIWLYIMNPAVILFVGGVIVLGDQQNFTECFLWLLTCTAYGMYPWMKVRKLMWKYDQEFCKRSGLL